MRKGLVISLGLHAAILFWSVAVFPAARDLNAPKIQPVPVDIVSATEFTKIKAGKRDAKEVTPPVRKKPDKPKPVAKKKTPKPKPKKAKAARKKKPVKKAEPAPKVKKAKAKPAPKPKPKKKVAAKKPPKKKKPRTVERKREKQRSFDADRIAALLDKAPNGGSTASLQPAKKPASKPKPNKPSRGVAAGRDQTMSLSEIDALRARISQCWNPPTGGLGADALKVKLRLRLGRDGMLASRPEVVNKGASPFFVAAADSAVRAVMLCQPYQLPATKYALWRDMILNFDPREMFGG